MWLQVLHWMELGALYTITLTNNLGRNMFKSDENLSVALLEKNSVGDDLFQDSFFTPKY